MLYALSQYLEQIQFPGARMFAYVSFRSLASLILALLISSIAAGLFDVSRICLTSAASSKSGTRLRKLANSRRSRSG